MKCLIKITDTHFADGETESSEITLPGSISFYGEDYKIRYRETDEALKDCFVTVSFEDGCRVRVTRSGAFNSEMIMEPGKRYICVYSTPAGNINMGIFTQRLESLMSLSGGLLKFEYSLDVNGGYVSRNILEIEIKQTT